MRWPSEHEHGCVVYRERDELRGVVVDYVRDSLKNNYTTVFIHHFDDDAKAEQFLQGGGLRARELLDQRLVLIADRNAAFQGGGAMIDHGHVARLVDEIIQDSGRRDRKGVRIFADAALAYIREGRESEWFSFEAWLGQRLRQRVALICAYPSLALLQKDIREQTEETHLGGIPVEATNPASESP